MIVNDAKELKDFELSDMVKQGIDNNIMVYDRLADCTITEKLIYQMWGITEDTLHTILMPTDVYPDFYWGQYKGFGYLSLEYIRDGRLNIEGSKAFIKKYEASMPPDKDCIILGLYGDGKILIGAV